MLHGRRNTPAKKHILPSLQTTATTVKIKAKTITKTTKIATKITKNLAVIKYTDNLIVTTDLKDITMSARKRIAIYRDIQRRNIRRLKRSIKAALVTKPKNNLITVLRNTLSSTLLTVKEIIVIT